MLLDLRFLAAQKAALNGEKWDFADGQLRGGMLVVSCRSVIGSAIRDGFD